MWTPLFSGWSRKPPRIDVSSAEETQAEWDELLASLSWLDRTLLRVGLRWLRRIIITVMGLTVLALGIIMMITPGPGMVLAVAGLALLAMEYAWAKYLLRRLKRYVDAGVAQGAAFVKEMRKHLQGEQKSEPPQPEEAVTPSRDSHP